MPGFAREPCHIRVGDLPALRLRVAELGDDPACTERLLGQLSVVESLAVNRDEDDVLSFVPVRGCREIAERAIANLHGPAFKARRTRPRE